MTRRTLLIVASLIAVIVVTVAAVIITRIQSWLAMPELTITFATVETERPDGSTCIGGDSSPGIAKEILDLETDVIYVAGGSNPMPDDVWSGYTFILPWIQNSTRHLLFTGSCFFRSPDAPADCVGSECMTIEEHFGYTWLKLNTVEGQTCYPDASGCSGDTVQPGYVSITTITKCHEITFTGTIYELDDGAGNRYVMHATGDGLPSVSAPVLPMGWSLTERSLDEPLVLLPRGGGDACYYNIIRDNTVQSFHQFAFAEEIYPPSAP